MLLGVGRAPDWTGQTCRARYLGPDLPKLTLVPPSPAREGVQLTTCTPPRYLLLVLKGGRLSRKGWGWGGIGAGQLTLLQNTPEDLSHDDVDAVCTGTPSPAPLEDANPSKDYVYNRANISILKT